MTKETRARRIMRWLAPAAGYAALTLLFTWPLVTQLSTVLPHDLGDPVLATRIFWWNAHVTPLTERWWNAPHFWPTSGVTTFSEHLLGIGLLTSPLQWLGAGPVTAYNVAFLVTFPLSAIGAHALAFRLTRRHDASVIAGLIYGFNPYRAGQLAHVQVLWSFLMPFALLALHAFKDDGRIRWLALMAVLVLLQGLGNGYYLVYFPILVGLWTVWFFDVRADIRRAGAVAVTGAIAVACALPVLAVYLRVHRSLGFQRGIGEIRDFSADLMSLTWTAPELTLWGWRSAGALPEQQLFFGATALLLVGATAVAAARRVPAAGGPWPRARMAAILVGTLFISLGLGTRVVGPWRIAVGAVTLATLGDFAKPFGIGLAALAVAVLLGRRFTDARRRRSVFGFYVFAAIALFILAMGPNPAFRQTAFVYRAPYAWLMSLPGFTATRVPARLGMLIALCLSAAAALGFARSVGRLPARWARAAAPIVIAGILADSWMFGLAMMPVPPRVPALEALENDTPILELPMGETTADLAAMYRSIHHGHPVVNGWSGYFPAYYDLLRYALKAPREQALSAFGGIGAAITVVVDERAPGGAEWLALVGRLPGAKEVGRDAGRRLFAVPDARTPFNPIAGPAVPIRRVTSNETPVDLTLVTDGNRLTAWRSATPQRGGEVIAIDLGESHRLAGFTMSLGQFTADFPRALAIDLSEDGRVWTPRPPPVFGQAIAAARRDPLMVPIPFVLAGASARYVRLRQLGADEKQPWSIAELVVHGVQVY